MTRTARELLEEKTKDVHSKDNLEAQYQGALTVQKQGVIGFIIGFVFFVGSIWVYPLIWFGAGGICIGMFLLLLGTISGLDAATELTSLTNETSVTTYVQRVEDEKK